MINTPIKKYYQNNFNKYKKVIVAIHGFAGNKNSNTLQFLHPYFELNRYALLSFDLHGHGNNEIGITPDIEKCLICLEDAIRIARLDFPNLPISLYATSFGAYIALLYLTKITCNLDTVILRVPAINPIKTITKIFAEKTLPVIHKGVYVSIKLCKDIKLHPIINKKINQKNIYTIISECDTIVDNNDTKDFCKALNIPIYSIAGANHKLKTLSEKKQLVSYVIQALSHS